ncbi:dynactin complex subunit [Encephalitozoon intestinalis ATCC 50506]|uniref:Dynactin complex subunit n=1 Tax=Encephalitozoon intestinalis (strain ATCC 50506) TaxID=876142 RepID=E0S7G2_ENCIT|nr:dynactin complex subunit [Encephalitozoon intestinalis ATCC 50506]ADM11641.1 dynactin complex subunit [Encephalitozoon intestinalis ATCC 50506]UTX45373.1 CAP-Gly domain-containing protein [Encephalitozoon intestinalis]
MSLLTVNDRLTLGDKFKGTVRYIGRIKSKDGKWIGLELDDPVGANNGSVNGVRYFHCKDRHGIFIRYEKIREGLVCEPRDIGEPRTLEHQAHVYESKIRRLEETIEGLKNTEREEIVGLRRENEEIKKTILFLQRRMGLVEPERNEKVYSELKELAEESKKHVSDMVDLVSDVCEILNRGKTMRGSSVKECERHRVVFLVSRIIDGVLDGDMEAVEHFKKEFGDIMKKHGISVG